MSRATAAESAAPPPGSDLLLERRDGVVVLTFHRPRVLNAFRPATFDQLDATLAALFAADDVRAVVLTGAGRAFCAGDDLGELGRDLTGRAEAWWTEWLELLQRITRRIAASPKPVVAAVNGPAVGFGAELPLACHARIAAEGAYFLFPEVARALLHMNGTFHWLPRIVGLGRATQWLVTGERVPAAEALAAGLVTRVVEGERLVDAAVDLAARMPVPIPPAWRGA